MSNTRTRVAVCVAVALLASVPPIAAQTTASVTGTVRNAATNAPLRDITVRVYTAAGSSAGSGRSNASGVYSVTGLSAGTYYLRTHFDSTDFELVHQCFSARPCADYPGFYSFGGFPVKNFDPVTLAAGQVFTADFALQQGGTITGRITNALSGNPVPGGHAYIYDGSGMQMGATPPSPDSTGRYSQNGLPPGNYFISADGIGVSRQIYNGRPCDSVCRPHLTGDPVPVVAGQTTSGINFSIPSESKPPFGVFETPVGDSTPLQGSIAVTGWALDDVGVQQLEIWRDLQPGETTPPFASTAGDPRNGKVFIAPATFVDGARPDVEALYSSTPFKSRAGWGYLLLTWGLWNQGNGTYTLYAYALDQDSNVATIGKKTIVVSNNAAARPFGSIDTPEIGGTASGPNYGWALTPKVNGVATCKIQPSGVQVSIDSGPLQPVVYGADVRTDVAETFAGFSNSSAAGAHYIFDWSTLTNGPHTIGWFVTDDCNRADGIGSRFFNVTGGKSVLTAVPEDFRLKAETTEREEVASAFRRNGAAEAVSADRRDGDAVLLARGYGELPAIVEPGSGGSRTVEMKQTERIEVRLPRGYDAVYQLGPDGQRRALPVGSSWDAGSRTLYWQPTPGFLGRFRFVFTNGSERISVRVVITP